MFANLFFVYTALWSLLCLCPAQATESSLRQNRDLQDEQPARVFDRYFPDFDECMLEDGSIGACDETRFPACTTDQLICFNRRPRQDRFHADNRQPLYFIDYQSVFCYPTTWGGCSSCHPGRLCLSENRCILEEIDYPCEKWW